MVGGCEECSEGREGERMLTIVVNVDAPTEDVQGVKEDVAILLEPLGEVRVLSVRAETPEQYRFDL